MATKGEIKMRKTIKDKNGFQKVKSEKSLEAFRLKHL
jgi:hypothetical protein